MITTKADIIAKLRNEILPLQGFHVNAKHPAVDRVLGAIKYAFPNASFPLAAVHEFISSGPEESAATVGFVGGLLGSLMQNQGVSLWIGPTKRIFPPAFKSFAIIPDKLIFIDVQKEKEILWVMEEALKCTGLSAVIAETPELTFTASRRLQLAVEHSHVPGFVLRQNPRNLNTSACVTRWKINSLPSQLEEAMPGVGFPRWNVELLKVRNGKPGTWQIEFRAGRFTQVNKVASIVLERQTKTG